MTRKISLRFILYFLGFYALIVVLTVALLIYSFFEPFASLSIYNDIREIDEDTIDMYLHHKDGKYTFTDGLLEFAEKKQATLQMINADGEVTFTSRTDSGLPTKYSYADLVQTVEDDAQYSWILDNGEILLYTEQTTSEFLMEELYQSTHFPEITEDDIAFLEAHDAIFDLYDKDGTILFTTNDAKSLDKQAIIQDNHNPLHSKEVKAYRSLDDGRFALIRTPNEHYESWDTINSKIIMSILKGIALFHLVLFILILILSLLIGRKFGRPILYFLRKIQRLAKRDYSDTEDGKISILKNGKIKRKYKMFADVNDSLTTLTQNLQSNELQIAQTQQLREDWITGLSHDLKTPLSTVLGYASMLDSEHEWTNEERRKFARIMEEKAMYMDELINDLTYTYQLKNKGIELELVHTKISDFIEACLANHAYQNVLLIDKNVDIYAKLDIKRFNRVIDNILVNAMTHNPADTIVNIYIYSKDDDAVIEIKDNGQGMSEETVSNLFNRYYRGTNTTSGDTGTGLGLTIAKQLIESHDGAIQVHSDSSGTTITITLPLIE